jgi:hypothetical protein
MNEVGITINDPDFIQITRQYSGNTDFLTKEGFIQYILDEFKSIGRSQSYRWLQIWGYDNRFRSFKSRPFSLVIHSENDRLGLTIRDALSTGVAKSVNNMIVESLGTRKTTAGVQLFSYYEKNSGIYTYGAYNDTARPTVATLDCTNSNGMLFSRPTAVASEQIQPHKFQLMMSAQCDMSKSLYKLVPKFRFT